MKNSRKVTPRKGTSARKETSTVRWRPEDWELIERLKKKTGIGNMTDLLRKALRDSAEKERL